MVQKLKNTALLKGVSDLTIYKLAYELMSTKTFRKGEIIFNDASYTEE